MNQRSSQIFGDIVAFVSSTFGLNQGKKNIIASYQVVRTKRLEAWARSGQLNSHRPTRPLGFNSVSINISQIFSLWMSEDKTSPIKSLLESLEILKEKKERKKNPEIFSLYNHCFTSENRHSLVWHLRPSETTGEGGVRVQNKGQRSWSLQCRERDWWVRSL